MSSRRSSKRLKPIVPLPKYGVDTVRIALDLPWLRSYEENACHWLYDYLTVKDIIQTFASIPVYEDCNEVLWETIENSLPEFWDIGGGSYIEIEYEFTTLVEKYYRYIDSIIPHLSDHVFVAWVTDSVILIDCNKETV